jgi:hypothetical protein
MISNIGPINKASPGLSDVHNSCPNPGTGRLPKCSLAYPINSSAGPFVMEK